MVEFTIKKLFLKREELKTMIDKIIDNDLDGDVGELHSEMKSIDLQVEFLKAL